MNCDNDDKCCKDYCFINLYDQLKSSLKLSINNKEYDIDHYNSFDSSNRIGFILINVPMDEHVNKIKKVTKKISFQVKYDFQKRSNH